MGGMLICPILSPFERSIYKGRKYDFDRKKLAYHHFQEFHGPSIGPFFHWKMAKISFFSYKMLTTAPINTIFGMHTHISPKYNIWSSTMTLKVNEGHWRSLKVNGRVTNWAKTQKQTIFKENLFGNFYSTLDSLSNGIKHCKVLLF